MTLFNLRVIASDIEHKIPIMFLRLNSVIFFPATTWADYPSFWTNRRL